MINISSKKLIFFGLCLGSVTISFNVAAISAVLPTMSADFGLPVSVIARIVPFYMIPYGIGALMYAPIAKRFSYRRVIIISCAIYAISNLICGIAGSINTIVITRALMGISGASSIPLGLILIGQLFDKSVRGRLVGVMFSCSFVSSLVGIVFSGLFSWRWLFFVPAILGVVLCIYAFIFFKGLSYSGDSHHVDYISLLKNNKEIRDVFIFIFIISLFYNGAHRWFGVYLSGAYGLSQLAISGFFIFRAVTGMFGQMAGGFISDKKGRVLSCKIGIVLLSVALLALFRIYPLWILAIIFAGVSVGWTIGHNGMSTILTDFPDEYRPEIASLNSSLRFISGGLGFLFCGMLIDNFGYSVAYVSFGACLFILFLLIKKFIKEKGRL